MNAASTGLSEPLVEVLRGPLVDSVHRGDLALVDANGTLLASVGDPMGKRAYWRSSAKPFQAMCVIQSGAGQRWSFSPEDIALISGSHNGEAVHTARAQALLDRIGEQPEDLTCGVHPPLDAETARTLQERGVEPSVLENNCSGNHIGMLALAVQLGVDTAGYASIEHPVQQEILQGVCRFTGADPSQVAIGIDGCGVPCFGLSVYQMAWAFARLMKPQGTGAVYERAAAAVASAMMAHPYLVAGRNRLDTALMEVAPGRLLSKGGAGGLQCIGITGGMGLAVKVEDGAEVTSSARPAGMAALEALRQVGVLDDLQMATLGVHARRAVHSLSGREVGEAHAAFRLLQVAGDASWTTGGGVKP